MRKLTHSRLRLNNDISLIVYKYLHTHRLKRLNIEHVSRYVCTYDDGVILFNSKMLKTQICVCCQCSLTVSDIDIRPAWSTWFCTQECTDDFYHFDRTFRQNIGRCYPGIVVLEYTIDKRRKKNNHSH
jgi:hypothetical protein